MILLSRRIPGQWMILPSVAGVRSWADDWDGSFTKYTVEANRHHNSYADKKPIYHTEKGRVIRLLRFSPRSGP
jgi:hypothetical protein